jgi:hypothetical protein
MAQTITTAKGNTAMTFNGSTFYSLFTAPSGSASRVILNALAFYQTNINQGSPQGQFILYNSSSNNIPIGFITGGTSASHDAFAIMPGNTMGAGAVSSGTAGTAHNCVYYFSASAEGNPIGSRPSYNCYAYSSSSSNYGYFFPAQFFMSSGDQFGVKLYWSGVAGQCQYNFTIITES